MSKRKLIWNIGLTHSPNAVVEADLVAHTEALGGCGARVVATPAEARLATHDLLRTHRGAGLDRSEVAGVWAQVCRRVWKHKGVSMLSTPGLCAADKDQIRLALAPLIGVEVHLVFNAPPAVRHGQESRASAELDQVLSRWGRTFRQERLHVVAHESHADQWAAFLEIAGPQIAGPPILGREAVSGSTTRTAG